MHTQPPLRLRQADWRPSDDAAVFGTDYRAVLWKLTSGKPPTTLPADNLDDPEVYLLAKGLAEVVHGRLQATRAGFELRKQIERER
jgi:hypothetical protein